jgi:hypothetical protein
VRIGGLKGVGSIDNMGFTCSMEEMTLQEARLDPITFLYATDSRLRSSTESSCCCWATAFMWSTISSNLRGCVRDGGKQLNDADARWQCLTRLTVDEKT